jgi:hypothetical protein
MKTSFIRLLHSGFISVLMIVASSQSLYAANLNVIGSLEARGHIQVMTDSAPAAVNLADTTYAYIVGDRIKTGTGTGILTITGLGRIGLAPDTEASIAESNGDLNLALTTGTMAYALTPGSSFTIKAAGMTLHPVRTPVQQVSTGDEQRVTGWVAIGKDGKVTVNARDGRIEVSHGGTVQVVEAGQRSELQVQEGKLIATQGGGGAAAGGFWTANKILLAVLVIGGGIGYAVSTTGNNPKPLASP